MAKLARHNLAEVRSKGPAALRRVVTDVRRELEKLKKNPDGYRGSRTVAEAEADIRAEGHRRINAIKTETASFLVEGHGDLDDD